MNVLKSRKFWAALVAVAFAVLKDVAPNLALDEATVLGVVLTLVGYILGTALEDGLSAKAKA